MSDVKNKRVVIYIDQASAADSLNSLQKTADKLNKKIEEGRQAGKSMTAELKKLSEVNASIKSVQDQIEKGLKPSLVQQEALVRKLNNELKRLSQNDPAFAEKSKQYQKQNQLLAEMRERLAGVQKAGEEMGGTFGKVFSHVAEVATAYFAFDAIKQGLTDFFADSIDEAEGAEKATTRLKNILDNLGRADTFDRIIAKADELADTFKSLDNDDITEVFQQLITYGKLTEKQMNDLLPLIINFAAKSSTSINESAGVIIKALEGNAKALKEYGINIKDGSTVTERFGILMSELGPKVDGAAKAFEETTGKAAVTKQAIANIKEEVGTKLLPTLYAFYNTELAVISGLSTIFETVKKSISNAISFIKLGTGVLKDFITLQSFKPGQTSGRVDQFLQETGAIKEVTEAEKDRLQVQEQVSAVARDVAKLTLKEQETRLKQSIALRDASLTEYKEVTKTGKFKRDEEHKAALQYIRDREEVLALEKVIAQTKDKKTFGGDPNEDPEAEKKAEAARKKEEAARQKADDQQKRLLEQYNEFVRSLNRAITGFVSNEGSDKLHAIFNQTADDLEKLKKLAQTDEQYQKGKLVILEKQRAAIHALLSEDAKNAPSKVSVEIVPEITQEDAKTLGTTLARVIEKVVNDRKAGLDLNILTAVDNKDHKGERDARLARLKDEHDDEMANKQLTDNQRLLKEQEYQDKVKEINRQFLDQWLQDISQGLEFAGQVTNILEKFSQARANKENADLKNELKGNDAKKASFKKQLDDKVISQQRYNQLVANLDKEAEAKKEALAKKQFERNKKFQLAQAGISGAQAVLTTIRDFGPPIFPNFLGIGAMILTLGTIAAEVSAIVSQKFARGGQVQPERVGNGKITNRPNIPRQPNGDDVFATVKVGEVILNEEQQRRLGGAPTFRAIGVPGFASGGTVRPFWQNRPYRTIDFNRVAHSIQVVKFAEGGKVMQQQASAPGAVAPASDPAVLQALQEQRQINIALMGSIQNLNAQLASGIETKFSLRKYDEARAQEQRINDEADFR